MLLGYESVKNITLSYPPERRIRSKNEFTAAVKNGKRFNGTMVTICYIHNSGELSRLGISIGRTYGNSVKRNRFKRLVRETFRKIKDSLPSYDFVVMPKRSASGSFTLEACSRDFNDLISKLPANGKT